MERRRGISLSSKMIATSTALISGIVVLFGFLNTTYMARVYDEQGARLRNVTIDNLKKRGNVQTRDLVQAGGTAVLNSDYSTLQTFVPQLASAGDEQMAYAFIADKEGTILAHTDASKNSTRVSDEVGRQLLASPEPGGKTFEAQRLLAFSRFIEREGQRVGTVVIAFNLAPLDAELASIEADKVQSNHSSTVRTVLLGIMFVLFGSAIAVFQGMRISQPIQRLAASADLIAQGDLSSRAEVTSSDEIGRLGESFNYMANQLVVLLEETREKAVLDKEMELARAIQETLVPTADLVDKHGVRVCGHFMPSSRVGGDWWTVHDLPGDRLLIAIGDVTGHGTPAAMITAAAKAACDTVRYLASDKLTVSHLLEVMNRAIYESARRRFVMTCFAAIVDTRRHTITFANAGHNFPYLYRKRGETSDSGATGEAQGLQVLMARGNPLGDAMDSSYAEKTQHIEANDVLVWYTDGVVECENAAGEQFGEKRFRAAIRAASGLDPQAMRNKVVGACAEFYGSAPRKDDITMVFAKVSA